MDQLEPAVLEAENLGHAQCHLGFFALADLRVLQPGPEREAAAGCGLQDFELGRSVFVEQAREALTTGGAGQASRAPLNGYSALVFLFSDDAKAIRTSMTTQRVVVHLRAIAEQTNMQRAQSTWHHEAVYG